MAMIIILFGSILGFIGGMTAYVGFDAPLLGALSIWLAAGPMAAMVVITGATVARWQFRFRPVLAKVA
jgi:hypothetical protein